MLQLRCPFCDAPIETHAADSPERVRCSRCGSFFEIERGPAVRADREDFGDLCEWTVHVPAMPGGRIVRLVHRLAMRPLFLVRKSKSGEVRIDSPQRPSRGRVPKRRTFRWLSKSEWRTIAFALVVFVGVPAAVIFFLLVVCVPRTGLTRHGVPTSLKPPTIQKSSPQGPQQPAGLGFLRRFPFLERNKNSKPLP